MATFNPFRNDGIPQPRLESAKLITFFDLDVSELMALGVFWFLAPVVIVASSLELLGKLLSIGGFAVAGGLLFFLKVDERNLAYWVGRLLPFWLRQRRFRARSAFGRVTPETERLDLVASFAGNSLSFERRTGTDGVAELHVFEHPLRPYRARVAAPAGTGGRRVRLPGTR
jgi:hypothetical protein